MFCPSSGGPAHGGGPETSQLGEAGGGASTAGGSRCRADLKGSQVDRNGRSTEKVWQMIRIYDVSMIDI